MSIIPLSEDYNYNQSSEQPDADPTIFAIVFSVIKSGQHWPIEDLPGIGEVQTVLPYIGVSLFLIPL